MAVPPVAKIVEISSDTQPGSNSTPHPPSQQSKVKDVTSGDLNHKPQTQTVTTSTESQSETPNSTPRGEDEDPELVA